MNDGNIRNLVKLTPQGRQEFLCSAFGPRLAPLGRTDAIARGIASPFPPPVVGGTGRGSNGRCSGERAGAGRSSGAQRGNVPRTQETNLFYWVFPDAQAA